jgi:hypothetical protein
MGVLLPIIHAAAAPLLLLPCGTTSTAVVISRTVTPILCQPLEDDDDRRRTGKRVGGLTEKKDKRLQTANMMSIPWRPAGVALLLLFLLKSLIFPGTPQTTFRYSVSSYSSTTVRLDDSTGQPKYETKTESSFRTNVPGLAERLAQEGKRPEAISVFQLFDDTDQIGP